MDALEPEGLLFQARAGNRAALGQLLEMYRSYLILLAGVQIDRRFQGKINPSDLVQDTFLKAHRHFGQFQGRTQAEWAAWLRRILASNLADMTRHYGRRRRDVRLEQAFAEDLDRSWQSLRAALPAGQSTPSGRAARGEQALVLADALARLSADYREVIILRHLEGMSFPETASRMGRSTDSVKKLWARGLAALRDLMGEEP
jgi:RNA polymerase sigma-70 factor (ECF subfamily)